MTKKHLHSIYNNINVYLTKIGETTMQLKKKNKNIQGQVPATLAGTGFR